MRLSLIAMVLCLCAAWPGHGLAWGMVGSADPAEGEVRFYAHPYPVSYGFISKWNPVAAEYIDFSAEHFTEGMVMRVQLANTANPVYTVPKIFIIWTFRPNKWFRSQRH